MNLFKSIITSVLLLNFTFSIGQDQADNYSFVDSINAVLSEQSAHDTIRIQTFLDLSSQYYFSSPDTMGILVLEALRITDEVEEKNSIEPSDLLRYKSYVHSNLGIYYGTKGDTSKCSFHYHQALTIFQEQGDKKNEASINQNLGNMYSESGDYELALKHLNRAVELNSEIEEYPGLAFNYNSIGVVKNSQGLITEAINLFHKALEIERKLENDYGICHTLMNIGAMHYSLQEYDEALEYFNESYDISKEIDFVVNMMEAKIKIAATYREQGHIQSAIGELNACEVLAEKSQSPVYSARVDYNKGLVYLLSDSTELAHDYFESALEQFELFGFKSEIVQAALSIGNLKFEANDLTSATIHAQKAYDLAREIQNAQDIEQSAGLLAKIAFQKNNYKEAYEYLSVQIEYQLERENTEHSKAIIRKDIEYEFDKKAAVDSVNTVNIIAMKDASSRQKDAELGEKRFQLIAAVCGLVLILLIAVVAVQRLRVAKIKNDLIEKQKKLDLSLVISDNKMRQDFELDILDKLQNALDSKDETLRADLRSIVLNLKNQSGIQEKLDYLSQNLDEIHSEFNANLETKFPELTKNELEVCHLIRLNLSIKEIAELRQTSPDAIKTARYRIKKKLQIEDQDLDSFLKNNII